MSGESEAVKPRSDLGVRTLSGVVMMSIAIAAIWFGGYAFMALTLIVCVGVLYEFVQLVLGFAKSPLIRFFWIVLGIVYVGLAGLTLFVMSVPSFYWTLHVGMLPVIVLISGVIGTDVGAYFAGRTFGGPKIAPSISPSKTWSGLFGGMFGAGLAITTVLCVSGFIDTFVHSLFFPMFAGAALAIIAQTGDFFESWMKRKAGVKDSGRLIPGHGGLFDRTDGLIAVLFVLGLILLAFMSLMALDQTVYWFPAQS
jgi:phosphatidate cytidylyltransferase